MKSNEMLRLFVKAEKMFLIFHHGSNTGHFCLRIHPALFLCCALYHGGRQTYRWHFSGSFNRGLPNEPITMERTNRLKNRRKEQPGYFFLSLFRDGLSNRGCFSCMVSGSFHRQVAFLGSSRGSSLWRVTPAPGLLQHLLFQLHQSWGSGGFLLLTSGCFHGPCLDSSLLHHLNYQYSI